jgi:integrase
MENPVLTKFNFTQSAINALPSRTNQYEVRDTKCPGLVLRVNSKGSKTFLFWQMKSGKNIKVKIGRFTDVSVEQARNQANIIRQSLNTGELLEKRDNACLGKITFKELYARYYAEHALPHTKRPLDNKKALENHIMPRIGGFRIADVTKHQMKGIHLEMGETVGRTQSNRLLDMTSAVFAFGINENLLKEQNPCIGIKRFKRNSRDRFLSTDELAKFFDALSYEEEIYQDFFTLLLFIGARKTNTLTMKFIDIQFELKQWRVISENAKNDEINYYILTDAALEIILRRQQSNNLLKAPSPFVFPGTGKAGHLVQPRKAIDRIRKRMGVFDFTIHDLRRTLGSHMAINNSSLPIIGRALNHKSQASTEIYARLSQDSVHEAVMKATNSMLERENQVSQNRREFYVNLSFFATSEARILYKYVA